MIKYTDLAELVKKDIGNYNLVKYFCFEIKNKILDFDPKIAFDIAIAYVKKTKKISILTKPKIFDYFNYSTAFIVIHSIFLEKKEETFYDFISCSFHWKKFSYNLAKDDLFNYLIKTPNGISYVADHLDNFLKKWLEVLSIKDLIKHYMEKEECLERRTIKHFIFFANYLKEEEIPFTFEWLFEKIKSKDCSFNIYWGEKKPNWKKDFFDFERIYNYLLKRWKKEQENIAKFEDILIFVNDIDSIKYKNRILKIIEDLLHEYNSYNVYLEFKKKEQNN